jgi:peptidoglycan/LPS O-acetylase OafA/YrhL
MIIYHSCKHLGLQVIFADFSQFYYLTFFMVGISLHKNNQKLVSIFSVFNKKVRIGLYLLAILLYTNYSNVLLFFPKIVMILQKIIPSDYIITLGSVMFMLLILSERSDNKILSNKYLVYIGKISFSLYLIHPVIIMLICFTLGATLPFYVLHPLCFIVSLIVSVFFYKLIELPTQKLGYFLTKNSKLNKLW